MAGKKTFVLRLNQETYEAVEKWAADEFRSVNGQIESILHEAISRRRKKAAAPARGGPAGDGNKGDGGVGPALNRADFQDQDPLLLKANRQLQPEPAPPSGLPLALHRPANRRPQP